MVAIITSEKDGVMRVTPLCKADEFPVFTEIEIKPNGEAVGWAGNSLRSVQMQTLGKPGTGATVISNTATEVLFKTRNYDHIMIEPKVMEKKVEVARGEKVEVYNRDHDDVWLIRTRDGKTFAQHKNGLRKYER